MPQFHRKGSTHIWVRGSVAGRPFKCTSGTADPAKAEEFEHALRERFWRQIKLGDRGAVSFREAATKWLKTLTHKTRKQDEAAIKVLLAIPHLADSMVRDINLEALEGIREIIKLGDRSDATVNRNYLGVMRRVLRKCVEWGYLAVVPKTPMYSIPVSEARWLTPPEFERLCRELPEHLELAARFAVHTGLRMRAQLSLKWQNVDLKRRQAWIEAKHMKGGKTHRFPLSPEAIRVLHRLRALHPEGEPVFQWRGQPIDDCNTVAFQDALGRARITDANWHTLRHTFASWAVQGGVTLQELMKLGPWESYDMALRYGHLAPDGLAKAVSKVARIGNRGKRHPARRKATKVA
jgi:integrase